MSSEGQQAVNEAVQKKLALGRSSNGGAEEPAAAAATVGGAGASYDTEQQQQGWRMTTEAAQQQAARNVRQPRSFLLLDGAGGTSLTSSGGYGLSAHSSAASLAEQGDTVLIGGLRRYTAEADDDAFEPVAASSGWEGVPHLRQQHRGVRASLATSADVSRALRHGNVTEAAYLSSMASQVHILHDAVAQKPQAPDGLPAVPVVPPMLAVRRKQRWWVVLLKLLSGAAGTAALVGAVAFAAAQSLPEGGCGSGSAGSSKQQQGTAGQAGKQKRVTQQQAARKQQQAAGMPRLPYVPVGPAPAASAGCG
ncbi:hypothetical protein COO60DRAFT_1478563 [Scenedesmus sp. NREL 46B-D3]|nr:hypothetical protein COO60DRAFT_1478563 [Scenedesmus sp. NREL 46B-D3]